MDRRGEKKDDDEAFIPFQGLEKGIVLQEKRIFNETPLNPRKCCQLLTKLLYLVNTKAMIQVFIIHWLR